MNRKRNIQFAPDSDPAGTDVLETTETVAEATTPAEPAKPEAHDWNKVAEELGEKPVEKTDAKVEKTPEELATEKSENPDEKPGDEELEVPIVSETPEVEPTWIEVATELGIAPPEKADDFEAFKTNTKAAIEKAREEGKALAESPDPDKFSPDERLLLTALKGGKKLTDIIEPLQPFNETLAMSDRALCELNLKEGLKLNDDQIADQMAIYDATDGAMSLEAAKIRAAVTNLRTTAYNKIIADGKTAWDAESTRQSQKLEKENTAIIAEIRSRKEFAGAKLEEQHLEALVKNWNNGTYRKELDNPKSVVDLILQKEFGQKRYAALLAKTKSAGKLEVAGKLANSPAGTGANVTKQSENVTNPNDHWARVQEEMKDVKIKGKTSAR